MKTAGKQSLMSQILKFAVVGGLSFLIDFAITLVVSKICRMLGLDTAAAATVGGLFGFSISLVFNYFMSMKFVFERRDDMDRKKEFAIFALLSVIGLGINELILYFGVIICDKAVPSIVEGYPSVVTAVVKMFATGIVMVYNFVTRKIFIEKKERP